MASNNPYLQVFTSLQSVTSETKKKLCGFCLTFSWITCSGRSQLLYHESRSTLWGNETSHQHPSFLLSFRCYSPVWCLDCNLMRTLSQNHLVKPLPNSWPQKIHETINLYCFKPLSFGVISYEEIGNLYSYLDCLPWTVKDDLFRASLVVQWLRICLPMQGTRVQALVWEDPTCRGATGPVSHKYWACTFGACAPQQERLRQWEARAPRWRVAPTRHN